MSKTKVITLIFFSLILLNFKIVQAGSCDKPQGCCWQSGEGSGHTFGHFEFNQARCGCGECHGETNKKYIFNKGLVKCKNANPERGEPGDCRWPGEKVILHEDASFTTDGQGYGEHYWDHSVTETGCYQFDICPGNDICSNPDWGHIFCYVAPEAPTPTPGKKEPAILLGRVVDNCPTFSSCHENRFFYGDNCGNEQCHGAPNYTVSWTQGSESGTINNNNCYPQNGVHKPRYTFEWTENPVGDSDGEEITVSISVAGSVSLRSWHLETTTSSHDSYPDSLQSGTFSNPGPNQTFNVKVYRSGEYKWNHLWFFADCAQPTSTPTVTPQPTITPTPYCYIEDLVCVDTGKDWASFSWRVVNPQAGEKITIRRDINTLIADNLPTSTTSYDDDGLSCETTYRYDVSCWSQGQGHGKFVNCTTTQCLAPTSTPTASPTPSITLTPTPSCPMCPSNVEINSVSNNSTCNLEISWNDVVNAEGYEIYRDNQYQTTVGANTTSWVDTQVSCQDSAYNYEVRPIATECPELDCSKIPGYCPCPTATPSATPIPTSTPTLPPGVPTNTPAPTATPTSPPSVPTSTPLPTATPTTPPGVPTSTPLPTATPRVPIATPTPTLPPGAPTSTPLPTNTPTPTPEEQVSCACWGLTANGDPDLTNVKRGQTLTFVARAYVPKTQPAYVHEMIYILYKESKEVVRSPIRSPIYIGDEEIGEGVQKKIIKVYQSNWSYKVPDRENAEGLYFLKLIIHCKWEESLNVKGRFVQVKAMKSSNNPSELNPVLEIIRKIFGYIVEFFSPQGPTLKLGSFKPKLPLPEAKDCTELYFQVLD